MLFRSAAAAAAASIAATASTARAASAVADTPPAGHDASAARLDVDALDIEVRFELARQHWPLAALAQWRVGEALPLDVPLADATVGAWVHDRCVASGRLVVVGDRLGLRIDSLRAAD